MRGLDTRDLVTLAILSALGGVLSAYVGYLANLINSFVGTPFGAGQVLAGLHVFWLILARGMTRRVGSGTVAGILKGLVEMLAGSVHGVLVVLVSAIEGFVVDLLLLRFRSDDRLGQMLAGGLATSSNVFVFQFLFLSGVPVTYILILAGLAFASGVLFAGYFAWEILRSLTQSGRMPTQPEPPVPRWRIVLGYVLVAAFLSGGVWYYSVVYNWGEPEGFAVKGLVGRPYTYVEHDFGDCLVTVEAELKGSFIHVEPRNYTGVLLSCVLRSAEPKADATRVRLTATDGYKVVLDLGLVMGSESILIVSDKQGARLVGAELDGSLWIRDIKSVELI